MFITFLFLIKNMEIIKEYEYLIDGKKVSIKRAYNVKGTKISKKNELDEYFKNNAEIIKSSKKLNNILEDYNNKHKNKISFSMLYQKYKAVFGTRKSQKNIIKNDDKVNDNVDDNIDECVEQPTNN